MSYGTWPRTEEEYVDGYAVKKSQKHHDAIDIWGTDGSYSLLLPGWPMMRRYPASVHIRINDLRNTARSGMRARCTLIPPPGQIELKEA